MKDLKEMMEFSLQNKAIAEIAVKVALDYAESVRNEMLDDMEVFIKNNQDCGACNLDIEIKEYLSQLFQKGEE